MPIAVITQEETRAKNFALEMQTALLSVDTPAEGDIALFSLADGSVGFIDENRVATYIKGSGNTLASSAKGATLKAKTAETEVTCSGATTTATGLIPAKAKLIGVAVRVTTLIVGPTSFTIGDGSDADRWGATIALLKDTVTSEANATADPGGWSATAMDVVLTGTGGSFSAGKVRITAFYYEFDGATS